MWVSFSPENPFQKDIIFFVIKYEICESSTTVANLFSLLSESYNPEKFVIIIRKIRWHGNEIHIFLSNINLTLM